MKKNLCKIISTMLILSMLLVETNFTSFGVGLFNNTKKSTTLEGKKYYQLLENNSENNNENNTNQSTEITEQQSDNDNQGSDKDNNQGNNRGDNSDIEPRENNNSSKGEAEEPEEDPQEDGQQGQEGQSGQEGEQGKEGEQGEQQGDNNEGQDNNQPSKSDNNTEQSSEQTENIENNNEQSSENGESSKDNTTDSSQEQSSNQSEGSSEQNTNTGKIEQEEKTATESEIENAGIDLEELDKTEAETSSPSDAENNVNDDKTATESETEKIDNEQTLATSSETVATDSEANIATISTLEQYILLDSLAMINHFGGKATKENETITLNADIKTKYPIIFNENTTLNLNGHDITQEGKGYAIVVTNKKYHVENEELIIDNITEEENKTQVSLNITDDSIDNVLNIHAIIMKDLTDKETIYVDNASLSLNNVKIHAAETKDCIYLNNSHFTMQNSYVFGGNGNATSENGGAGIYAKLDNESYNINLTSGSIRGGNGAASNNGNIISTNKALTNSFLSLNVNEHTFDGAPNEEGCGKGGNGIYIDNDDYELSKVTFGKNMVVTSGDGGKRIRLRAAIFGLGNDGDESYITNLSKYCLAKTGSETDGGNGTNLSMVSPLKDQGQSNLCNVFSYTASAETYLMKHYRTYVNTMIAEDSSNLDFSEEALAFGLYNFISDPLGNAPDIYNVDMGSDNYKSAGTNPEELDVTLANLRGIAPESVAPWLGASSPIQPSQLYNNIDLSYSNKVGHLYEDEATFLNQYPNRQAFVNDMKKKIYDGGVVFAGYFAKLSGDITTSVYGYQNIGTQDYIQQNYSYLTSTGDVCVFYNKEMPTTGYGGHAMYMVGWDDNFPNTLFPNIGSARPSNNGAFIVKNSWNQWDFISYDIVMSGYAQFHHPKWFPAYSQFENVYYYDTSYGQYAIPIEQGCINYQIQNDNERLQAVSIMMETSVTGESDATLKLYRINGINDFCLNAGTLLKTKAIKFHKGLNYYDVSDWSSIFNTGECFSILFVNQSGVESKIYFDKDITNLVATYSTTYAAHDNLFYFKRSDTSSGWVKKPNYMIRMKAYTNNKYDLTLNADGGHFSDNQETKTQAIYLTDKVNIETLERPQKTNKYFDGWYITKPSGNELVTGLYEITERNNQTLKASWSDVETYKVTFSVDGTMGAHPNASDVTNTPPLQSIFVNNKVSTPTEVPTAPGYEFIAWYKEPQCTTLWNFDTELITADTTIYAKWRAITYKLSFDLQGIQATTPSEITKTYGTNVTLPRPTNIQLGKKFVAWYKESALSNRYTGDADIATTQDDDHILYAKWEDGYEQHTIYFYPNGGKGSMEPQVVNEGVEVILKANEFTKSGYGFYRWSSSTGEYYNNEAKISSVTHDLYLTANWEKNTGGGGNGGGGGGGGSMKMDDKPAANNSAVKAEAKTTAIQEVANVALARGIAYEAIANNPVVQQFLTVESTALEYKKTVENILSQYAQSNDAKKDVFTPANQTAQKTKTAEKKLTEYEFVKNQTTGKTQLLDKATNKVVTNCWQEVQLADKSTKWYKVDAQGNLETGIIVDGNKIYLLEEANVNNYGAMVTGNYNIGMLSLEFKQDGSLTTMNYNEILREQYLNMVVTAAILGK